LCTFTKLTPLFHELLLHITPVEPKEMAVKSSSHALIVDELLQLFDALLLSFYWFVQAAAVGSFSEDRGFKA